jgi:hypothetical protein
MGTRSLIIMRVIGAEGTIVIWAILFQTFDGDLSGVGERLLSFLKNMRLLNGIPCVGFPIPKKMANGPGDLFAQIIALFKGTQIGAAYLLPPPADNVITLHEYTYSVDVQPDGETVTVGVVHCGKTLFNGRPEDALILFNLKDGSAETHFNIDSIK